MGFAFPDYGPWTTDYLMKPLYEPYELHEPNERYELSSRRPQEGDATCCFFPSPDTGRTRWQASSAGVCGTLVREASDAQPRCTHSAHVRLLRSTGLGCTGTPSRAAPLRETTLPSSRSRSALPGPETCRPFPPERHPAAARGSPQRARCTALRSGCRRGTPDVHLPPDRATSTHCW